MFRETYTIIFIYIGVLVHITSVTIVRTERDAKPLPLTGPRLQAKVLG